MPAADPTELIVAALRLSGCSCDRPDFDRSPLADTERIVVEHVRVFHALDCPLCPPEYRDDAGEEPAGGRSA
ncbi:MAG TPA: hypothetical protein VH416_02155 [Gaiellaceae bacterium]|jgi:hypothetical protein